MQNSKIEIIEQHREHRIRLQIQAIINEYLKKEILVAQLDFLEKIRRFDLYYSLLGDADDYLLRTRLITLKQKFIRLATELCDPTVSYLGVRERARAIRRLKEFL